MPGEYRTSIDQLLSSSGSDAQQGLSSAAARERLARYGPNELPAEARPPRWRRFAAQFKDVLVLLLLVATVISAVLWTIERETALPYEAIAIGVILLLNAVVGYLQESRAASAVAALRQMSAANAHVVRDGERRVVAATHLVPGDILLVEEGDVIPADARLVEAVALQTNESALTGESTPVAKEAVTLEGETGLADRVNMIYSGTAVTAGRARALVTATGRHTESGRVAGLLTAVSKETTPLQKELDRTGRRLGAIVLAIATVMIVTIVLVDRVATLPALVDVLILGIALAVAAVPEGLPATVTAVLSIGVRRMARRNAIVRHLRAVETLGSASVIASDKTGTLTRNEMIVREIVTASGHMHVTGTGYEPVGEIRQKSGEPLTDRLRAELEWVVVIGEGANNAQLQNRDGRWSIHGDPTEAALIVAARKFGLREGETLRRFRREAEIPFSSTRRMMTTRHAGPDGQRVWVFSKGAPESVLRHCTRELVGEQWLPLSEARRGQLLARSDELAGRALRTLAVAFRPDDTVRPSAGDAWEAHDLIFAGLLGLIDPPRAEAFGAVAMARNAGVRPIMITGDHPRTAAVIAAELGFASEREAITGAELQAMSDEVLGTVVRTASVYARVEPEHKLRIVRALQRHGDVVAMTGDGVNDAPALKRADIGIAMGAGGTDVSRRAADIVLADDNFATIVAAVEEGRTVFANIRKFLRYLLSSNIGEVLTMFFGVLFAGQLGLAASDQGLALPLVAAQLLWINLVTDGAPALALGVEPIDPASMQRPPRPAREGIVTSRMWGEMILVGLVMAAGSLYVLDASLPGGLVAGRGSLRHAQTMVFTTLTLFQLFNLFNARSDDESVFDRLFVNGWLFAAVALSLLLQLVVIYSPALQPVFSTEGLTMGDWVTCTAVASSVVWVSELRKGLARAGRRGRKVPSA